MNEKYHSELNANYWWILLSFGLVELEGRRCSINTEYIALHYRAFVGMGLGLFL